MDPSPSRGKDTADQRSVGRRGMNEPMVRIVCVILIEYPRVVSAGIDGDGGNEPHKKNTLLND